ncbi:MAG TPA: 1-deoxy-D-xylulose-5-phosphate reductoisomerase [Gemmatimonadaceae bacterium]|nr:1-deoxy-D-xylulose-5-phosphate reductoisomerase [Gemmatimonadaceae bacterium]
MTDESNRQGVAILGSTGSIGTTALRVLSRHPDRFRVAALTAFSNADLLKEQTAAFRPPFAELVTNGGRECLVRAATRSDVDIVLNAVVGAAGLDATLAALEAGKRVALANKETLVMAGHLVRQAMERGGGEIVPVDSEHSAILQCMSGRKHEDVRRVVLTASGGPFRDWARERVENATADEALKHPTWRMGKKITVDSATLANKALEVIEAHYLFDLSYDQIDVVVHPQSVVHSFVEFVDGSVLAQMGAPSMEVPVLYALTHPRRIEDNGIASFDPVAQSPLTFERVRHDNFPALELGIEAGRRAGAAPAVFNAANEQAVDIFLQGRMRFGDIPRAIAGALDALATAGGDTRDALQAADAAARAFVRERY